MADERRKLDLLSEAARERVLARASEIDAARGTRVADLRAAATEAGISAEAFDQALAELESEEGSVAIAAHKASRRRRKRLLAGLAALALVFGVVFATRRVIPEKPTAPVVEQSYVLRCLSAADGARLVRDVLRSSPNAAVMSRGETSRIITVRAPAELLAAVEEVLRQQDGPGSAACTLPQR